MLNVSYKNRIGYYTENQTIGGVKKKYKIWFCHANCLCAMIHFYKDGDQDMVQLCGFFSDIKHAKECIASGFFRNDSNFHFKAKQMDSRLWKLVKLMTENGIKVTIE